MNVLIVNAVEWGPAHRDLDYPMDVAQWIEDGIGPRGGAENGAGALEFVRWLAVRETDPPGGDFDAVVISGSPASVYDDEPWIERLRVAIRDWAEADVPILGICFGHQAVVDALGGKVEKNPQGWEVGTQTVALTEAATGDPIFRDLPESLEVMESHQDVVTEPPAGAVCLAGNEMNRYQALAIGKNIRTVQFHPEYTPEHIRFLLEPRRERLKQIGVDMDAAMNGIHDTPKSRSLLRKFLEEFAPAESAEE